MAIEYAEEKVAEALEKAQGNKAIARQYLIEWIHRDHKLVLGLTALHMKGIIPFWVERVDAKQKIAEAVDKKTADSVNKTVEKPKTFGEDMLRTFAGQGTAQFGLESGSIPLRKKNASQTHIDAINLIVSKNKSKQD